MSDLLVNAQRLFPSARRQALRMMFGELTVNMKLGRNFGHGHRRVGRDPTAKYVRKANKDSLKG